MSSMLDLTITRVIAAPRQKVFEAWLDARALARFMKPLEEMPDCRVEVDPREGGEFHIIMLAGDKEVPTRGVYRTISRYDRIVLTWNSEYTSQDSTVTLEFKELGPSRTELTLHHVGFPEAESRDNHNIGWGRIVDTLNALLA